MSGVHGFSDLSHRGSIKKNGGCKNTALAANGQEVAQQVSVGRVAGNSGGAMGRDRGDNARWAAASLHLGERPEPEVEPQRVGEARREGGAGPPHAGVRGWTTIRISSQLKLECVECVGSFRLTPNAFSSRFRESQGSED